MPVIANVQPLVMKDVTFISNLTGGSSATAPDFKKHVSAVTFTPSASTVTWTGLGLNTHTDVSTASWVCTISYAQDWDSVESLSKFLFNNEGKTVDVTFKPNAANTPSFAAKLVITPGAIGGTVNAVAETSVTLGVTGKPVLT